MKTATVQRTSVEQAEPADILQALRGQYTLWNAGLSRQRFADHLQRQMTTTWGRRNLSFFVIKSGGAVVASCKFYNLQFQARARQYKVAGIGAVFTHEHHRGKGYASELMEEMVKKAQDERFDAVLLHSDIDESFYEQFGFHWCYDHEFFVWTADPAFERQVLADRSFAEDLHDHIPEDVTFDLQCLPDLAAQYTRHQRTAPFAMVRDHHYWQYKLLKEQYIQAHSSWARPPIEVLSIDASSKAAGYALYEQEGSIMRVLEVIGPADTREILWRDLLRSAFLRKVGLITGWESTAPTGVRGVRFVRRDRARPMLLPLNEDTLQWTDVLPFPLLELDHF